MSAPALVGGSVGGSTVTPLTGADRLVIATRNSPLALWQAEDVKQRLETRFAGLEVELLRMTTKGDVLLDSPLAKIGGKGLFVKELEVAILDGRADIAVHSIKDVPAELPDGLEVVTMLARENPRDAFVSNRYDSPSDLMLGSRIGTCSLRRQAQLLARRPDLDVVPLRGNVNTRLQKLDDGHYDAIVLAAAGLIRLGMQERIRSEFPIEDSLPAAGQGIVGIESRIDDERVQRYLAALHDPSSASRARAERGLSARLDGGCQVPIGAYSIVRRGQIWLRGLVATPDGAQVLRAQATASPGNAHALGVRVAEDLLSQGADRILADLGLEPRPLDEMSTVFAEPRTGSRGRSQAATGGRRSGADAEIGPTSVQIGQGARRAESA